MSLPIVWSAVARRRLVEITSYIAEHDAQAADRLWQRLENATLPLSEHPELFRPGRIPGTRELVVNANYILVYRVLADEVDIVNVLHSRQEYP